jgi:hypothetical protein
MAAVLLLWAHAAVTTLAVLAQVGAAITGPPLKHAWLGITYSVYSGKSVNEWPPAIAYTWFVVTAVGFNWFILRLFDERHLPIDAEDQRQHAMQPERHRPRQLASTPFSYGDSPNLWFAMMLACPGLVNSGLYWCVKMARDEVDFVSASFRWAGLLYIVACWLVARAILPAPPRFYQPAHGRVIEHV